MWFLHIKYIYWYAQKTYILSELPENGMQLLQYIYG